MSQEQKAIYQERLELCFRAANAASSTAHEIYRSAISDAFMVGHDPDPIMFDRWLELINESGFWAHEGLEYLDMIQGLEK